MFHKGFLAYNLSYDLLMNIITAPRISPTVTISGMIDNNELRVGDMPSIVPLIAARVPTF